MITTKNLVKATKKYFSRKDYYCCFGTPYTDIRRISSDVESFDVGGHIIERYIPKLKDYVIGIASDIYGITNDSAICQVTAVRFRDRDDITVKVIKHPDEKYNSREYDVKSLYFRRLTDEELALFNEEVNRNEAEGVTGS